MDKATMKNYAKRIFKPREFVDRRPSKHQLWQPRPDCYELTPAREDSRQECSPCVSVSFMPPWLNFFLPRRHGVH